MQTGVHNSDGDWPSLPEWFSFSSFTELEDCPRRWMLRRASYPKLWSGRGYPDLPSLASLSGDVIHGALERIICALIDAGCEDAHGESAVQVLRQLGGYSSILTAVLEEVLVEQEANPRLHDRRAAISRGLRQRLPDMRQKVQATLARTTIVVRGPRKGGQADHRSPLGDGSYPELEIRAADLRWAGRVDLVTLDGANVRITDYKTGEADPHHTDQLRLYALLWASDSEVNPDGRPATELVLSYPNGEVRVPAPGPDELMALQQELADRTSAALSSASAMPPPANPSPVRCSRCAVRHLCADYWDSTVPSLEVVKGTAALADAQLVVTSRNGPRSWLCTVEHPSAFAGKSVVLRAAETRTFIINERIRVLTALVQHDDNEPLALTLTSSSEVFSLT